MKDRRGMLHQAYLGRQTTEENNGIDAGMARPVEEASHIGPALEPLRESAGEPTPTKVSASGPEDAGPNFSVPLGPHNINAAGNEVGKGEADGAGAGGTANGPATTNVGSPYSSEPTGDAAATASMLGAAPAGSASNGGAPATGGAASYAGDEMGWDAAAFAEAGGYDAVVTGELPPGMCPGDGGDVFIFIDELNLEINNNTAIQETNINLIADDGSIIEIEGDFTAISEQETFIVDAGNEPTGFASEEPPPADDAIAA